MWEIVGDRNDTGQPVKLGFDGGLTSSATDFIDVMEAYCLRWGFVGFTPVGPFVSASIADETAAYLVALNLLKKTELVSGDVPKFPDLPAPAPNQAF